MHVVHLYDGHEQVYEGRGSVPGVVWNIARETAARGHDVTVVERKWDGLPERAEHGGVSFERIALRTGADEPWTRVPYEEVKSPLGLLRLIGDRTNFALTARRRLRCMDYDVLHVHLPFAANVLSALTPSVRDRMVYTAHLGELRLDILEEDQQGESDEMNPDVPSILAAFSPDVFLAKRAATTTVLNSNIESIFAGRGVPADSLHVIPNGVDIERFEDVDTGTLERVQEKYEMTDGPVLLFVGTLMPRKGVTEFVQAVKQVSEEYDHDVSVVLAGESGLDESYVKQVEQLIHQGGLEDRIIMPGFVPADDLPALYRAADLFVVPSLEEGFGMTAIEALAAGTPVVGTRVGGLPHIVEPGQTGELADPGDVNDLAAALNRALSTTTDTTAAAARTQASEYTWTSVTTDFIDIYEGITA